VSELQDLDLLYFFPEASNKAPKELLGEIKRKVLSEVGRAAFGF